MIKTLSEEKQIAWNAFKYLANNPKNKALWSKSMTIADGKEGVYLVYTIKNKKTMQSYFMRQPECFYFVRGCSSDYDQGGE